MSALPFTIYVSFAGALCALAAGRRARVVALVSAVLGFGLALVAAGAFSPSPGLQTLIDVPWIADLGIRYHLAADGISLTLVVLTGIAATAGVLFSWNIEERTGEFFALYLALIGGVYGVLLLGICFCARRTGDGQNSDGRRGVRGYDDIVFRK
jgi:NADH-quinone oxidoreductase subunit M